MKISRLTVAAGAIAMLAIGGMAPAEAQQTPQRPNARRGQMMAHPLLGRMALILARLDLTPAQKEQVRGLVQAAQVSAKAVRENADLTPEQKRSEMHAIVQKLRESIISLFTKEQKQKLRRIMANAPGRPGAGK